MPQMRHSSQQSAVAAQSHLTSLHSRGESRHTYCSAASHSRRVASSRVRSRHTSRSAASHSRCVASGRVKICTPCKLPVARRVHRMR